MKNISNSDANIKGDNNEIIQAKVVNNYGMSYTETKALCMDLIKQEIAKLSIEAAEEAKNREERLNNKLFDLLEEIKVKDSEALNELKNPDMQYSFIEAQLANIRVGTEELENILSNLLKERILEKERTTLQIALSEAIKVSPLLLPVHLNILSLVFIFKYTVRNTIVNEQTFIEYFNRILSSCLTNVTDDNTLYQHIEYSKCGTLSVLTYDIIDIIKQNYSGLFMRGFKEEEFINRVDDKEILMKYPDLLINHLRDNNLLQINSISENVLKKILTQIGLEEKQIDKIKDFFNENILSNDEIKQRIIELVPNFKKFIELWENSMNQLQLTSVGIILGAINLKNLIGENYNMKIWIK